MLLTDRDVVVYGVATGAVSRAVVVALAAAGARCALVGTDPAALDSAAALARARGGSAESAVLDPGDPAAVERTFREHTITSTDELIALRSGAPSSTGHAERTTA